MTESRKRIRPVTVQSILAKRFRSFLKNAPRWKGFSRVHPLFVLADLRRGNIEILATYIAQNRGLPDIEVALELCKLIAGSADETKFRLVVIDNPELPSKKGGRPRQGQRVPTKVEFYVVRLFDALNEPGASESAVKEVVSRFRIDESTVHKYRNVVRRYNESVAEQEEQQRRFDEVMERREAALASTANKVSS